MGAFDNFIVKDSRRVYEPEVQPNDDEYSKLPANIKGPCIVTQNGPATIYTPVSKNYVRKPDPRRAGNALGSGYQRIASWNNSSFHRDGGDLEADTKAFDDDAMLRKMGF